MEECDSIDSDVVKAELEKGKEYLVPCLGETGRFGGEEHYGRNAQWYGPRWILEFQADGISVPVYKIPLDDMVHGWD
ncbi:hypothetical protein ES703_122926 [subsurface metagenome]